MTSNHGRTQNRLDQKVRSLEDFPGALEDFSGDVLALSFAERSILGVDNFELPAFGFTEAERWRLSLLRERETRLEAPLKKTVTVLDNRSDNIGCLAIAQYVPYKSILTHSI